MELIKAVLLKKTYGEQKEKKQEVLKGINLSIFSGDYIAIMGKSGSGKTSLLSSLASMLPPTTGTVFFQGKSLYEMSYEKLLDFRRENIGYIFQDFRLLKHLSVLENILLPYLFAGKDANQGEIKAMELLQRLKIEKLKDRFPDQISGGEKQRVAICRALINNPKILFADELTGNLDSISSKEVMQILDDLNQNLNQTIVLVTHDKEVAEHCSKIVELKDGLIL